MDDLKQIGLVKWFNDQKGFGFIQSGGKDYFVHYKDICAEGFKTLPQGARVRFEAGTSNRGAVAKSVQFDNNH